MKTENGRPVLLAATFWLSISMSAVGASGLTRIAAFRIPGSRSYNRLKRLVANSVVIIVNPVMLPPGLLKVVASPQLDRIDAEHKHNRDCQGRVFCGLSRSSTASGSDQSNAVRHQFIRQCIELIKMALRPSIHDRQIAPFNVALLSQALLKGFKEFCEGSWCPTV